MNKKILLLIILIFSVVFISACSDGINDIYMFKNSHSIKDCYNDCLNESVGNINCSMNGYSNNGVYGSNTCQCKCVESIN